MGGETESTTFTNGLESSYTYCVVWWRDQAEQGVWVTVPVAMHTAKVAKSTIVAGIVGKNRAILDVGKGRSCAFGFR